MPVPVASALCAGTRVNIILKADQRSGRLTAGRIADILTRGDHPHGIKVRLQDGQIGRVQSLSSTPDTATGTSSVSSEEASPVYLPWASASPSEHLRESERPISSGRGQRGRYGRRGGGRGGLVAYADDGYPGHSVSPLPAESRSLGDYVTFAPTRGGRGKEESTPSMLKAEDGVDDSALSASEHAYDSQHVLQAEFPLIDSALIAAILSDGRAVEEARKVLAALSSW
ncbi:MAG: hypothetical protein LQ340_000950 [Diploschistes diacapsis]|nr:MAG: hypothetical protein LQ340_000950 [Diploschistes diacapsis]